jgi:S-DNA-T family DNA segregation ATPase FtsK/SpoIIIE
LGAVQIVFIDGDHRRELDVRVNNPAATIDDLARALDPSAADRALLIGERATDPDFDLAEAGLHEGAEVTFGAHPTGGRGPLGGGAPAGSPEDAPGWGRAPSSGGPGDAPVWPGSGEASTTPGPSRAYELVVVNGLDAGRRFTLATGTSVIGRAPGCEIVLRDGTLSRRHAALTLTAEGTMTVDDLESHNGTWVAGEPVVEPVELGLRVPWRLGALEIEVRPVDDSDRPLALDPLRHTTTAGTIPFNRPPRPAPPAAPAEVKPPALPKTGQGKVPLSLIGILTPLAFAGVMFAVMRSPQFLLFAGLTPLMGIANAVDGKRRGKRSERSEKERFARDLRRFEEQLGSLADEERRRREGASPDPGEILRRVTLPSVTLWERRPADHDFLLVRAGVGTVPWEPPVGKLPATADIPEELTATLAGATSLVGSPVPVDLSSGGVVGIVGDRSAALALARSLVCQAAALHGPADMPVMVLARPDAEEAWDWAKWLPHTRDAGGAGRMLSADPDLSTRLVESRLKAAAPRDRHERPPAGGRREVGPTLLVVVDDESLTEGRRAPTRSLLRGEGGLVAGIVVASTVDRLPAVCTTVVEMTDPDGGAVLSLPQAGHRVEAFASAGMADDVARACARALARFEDPELDVVGAGLPSTIRLLPLLELEECTPEAVMSRWKTGGLDPRPATPVGVSEEGVFTVDFVADGPHALVGGTTGSGKSELLRSMVAGLAASVDPDHLTFVLVDFKGGSAFDECAKLPHTVGMVTDLDEHLAERALRCLEAELKYRERRLRDAGATDLPDYLRKGLPEPMPRLLVIIDEFATLKAELPQFIDALVGVAQRGRSLGVHMLLATQRPQGAISDNIRANTNMRIALRVQETNDSKDVIDVPDAASIPRTAPGRAYVRLGPGEVVAIQSALSTGALDEASQAHVDVAPFVYGPQPRRPSPAPPASGDAVPVDAGTGPAQVADPDTDLSVLVQVIGEAFARTGRPVPRRPWPEMLPGDIDLAAVVDEALGAETAGGAGETGRQELTVPLAMADDPEAQAQYPMGWRPSEGNMIVYGIGGSGTTTALTSLVIALARLRSPDEVHVYALDFGAGELGALEPLPHVGGVLLANERERQVRLIRHLRGELDRRRAMGAAAVRNEPMVVTLVDGWSAFAAEYNDLAGNAVWEAFTRVLADGPEVGLYALVAADRAMAVPTTIASLVRQRLALRLADRNDYSNFGVRSTAVPEMVPGRALVAGTGQVVQIARPADGVAAAAVRLAALHPPPARPPLRVEPLPTEVALPALGATARLGSRPWFVPVGVVERTREPAGLVAYQGEHALVTGPARSGKSTTLLTVAAACRAARADLTVVAVAGPRSPLGTDTLVDEVVAPGAIGERLGPLVDGAEGMVLVLVDDAEAVDDVGGVLDRLSTSDRPDLLFVAAGRNDGIRSGYSHWTRPLRRAKVGVLLRPDIDLDGDILGAQLPRRTPVAMVTGRGFVACAGETELVQVALPR